jgi:hypothetical protein
MHKPDSPSRAIVVLISSFVVLFGINLQNAFASLDQHHPIFICRANSWPSSFDLMFQGNLQTAKPRIQRGALANIKSPDPKVLDQPNLALRTEWMLKQQSNTSRQSS